MDEKIKHKDADPKDAKATDLEEGLEDTFPGSDPVSASQPGGSETSPRPKPSDDAKR